jgi:2-C-methyl-D-erythritol 4-phosphate cytidylyltransferase
VTPSYWVVMPAAGAGRRMTGAPVPKQYLRLDGRCVIEHALAPFLADPRCLGVVVALAADDDRFEALPLTADARVRTAVGGRERRDSVLAGLQALAGVAGPDTWVLVHDAARPCLPAADLERLLEALPTAEDGALLALRVADTLKRADHDGRVVATVPREHVWWAQTPQAFRYARLVAALLAAPSRRAVRDRSSWPGRPTISRSPKRRMSRWPSGSSAGGRR